MEENKIKNLDNNNIVEVDFENHNLVNNNKDNNKKKYLEKKENAIKENKEKRNNYIDENDNEIEDEYLQQIAERRKKLEEKRKSKLSENKSHSISHHSKFSNRLKGIYNVKIYIFNSDEFKNFEVSYMDTVKDLKIKIYKDIEKDSKYKLKYKSLDGKYL